MVNLVRLTIMSLLIASAIYQGSASPNLRTNDQEFRIQTIIQEFIGEQNLLQEDQNSLNAFYNHLNLAVNQFNLSDPTGWEPKITDSNQIDIICQGCHLFYWFLQPLQSPTIMKLIYKISELVCRRIPGLDDDVCAGAAESLIPIYADMIFRRLFDPDKNCPIFRMCDPKTPVWTFEAFVSEILKDKPNATLPEPTGRATYKVLHIADPHIDLYYKEGSNEDCGEPVCCRDGVGKAGFWGFPKKNCDLPLHTFDAILNWIVKNVAGIEMIVWTGDNVAHDVWKQSKDNQTYPTKLVADMIAKKFGTNITMVTSMGNHECFPVNEWDHTSDRDQWLKDSLADIMTPFTNSTESLKTLRKKGFYSYYDKNHNMKLIGINTQAGNTDNQFLLLDPSDPDDMLMWLFDELKDSEAKNQSVFIMGHTPPGQTTCFAEWAKRYNVVIERFTHIFRGQFFGHTHSDHFRVQKAHNSSEVIGVCIVGPGQTFYHEDWPGFKVYDVDVDTNRIVNWHGYRIVLENSTRDHLEIFYQYEFLKQYGYEKFEWKNFQDLADRIAVNETLARTFQGNMGAVKPEKEGRSPGRWKLPEKKVKNVPWYKDLSCYLSSGNYYENYNCTNQTIWDDNDYLQTVLQEKFLGDWHYKKKNTTIAQME